MPFPNGTRIRNRREELDLSLDDLAERLGISKGYLRNIEGGHDPATRRLIHRIGRALALSFDDLMPRDHGQPEGRKHPNGQSAA